MRAWDKSKAPSGPWTLNKDSFQAQGLIAWWPFGGASGGKLVTEYGTGANKAITRGAGLWTIADTGAPAGFFDGTAGDTVAFDLSSYSKITVAFRMYWDAFANNDLLAMEYTANYNTNNGFIIDPNNAGTLAMQFEIHGTGGYNGCTITRPSAAVYHDYVVTFDRTTGTSRAAAVWVDGVQPTLTQDNASNVTTTTFDNATLNVMQRSGPTLQGKGRMYDLRIYGDANNGADRAAAMRDYKFELWYPLRTRKWFVPAAGGTVSMGAFAAASRHFIGVGVA